MVAGKYRLGAVIAESGHSRIHEAIQANLDRPVALRILRPHAPEKHRIDILAEARLCARLAHPSILAVYEIGDVAEGAFVAMELLDGETLRDRLTRDGRLPIDEAARFGAGILGALVVAHYESVVHPALSPAKVFLANFRGGRIAKLSDFAGQADADPRTDLHAAGVLIYETLTGSLPYATPDNPGDPTRLPPGPSETRDDVGLDADAFTTRALSTDLGARFQSAEEMLDAWSSIEAVESHLST